MSIYTLTNVRQILQVKPAELPALDLADEDVLLLQDDKRVLATNLHKALTLGKSGGKTDITFETKAGSRRVEIPVIAYDDKYVWLEGNYKLPLRCIRSVDFYK